MAKNLWKAMWRYPKWTTGGPHGNVNLRPLPNLRQQTQSYAAYKNRKTTQGLSSIPQYDQPLSGLPRDSEMYETSGTTSIVHAAAPNTLRVVNWVNIHGAVSINDDVTRIYDKYLIRGTFKGRTDGISQTLHLFTVKGPSTMTFGSGDKDPSAGIRLAIEELASGSNEIKYYRGINIKPRQENGAFVNLFPFEVDITNLVNKFTETSEKALGQARSQPLFYLAAAINGTASTTDNITYQTIKAYHERKRKLAV